MTTKREARRQLAAWLRDHGLVPAGEVWRLASADGVRDVDTLARAAAGEGGLGKRLPDGQRLPAGLRDGHTLPDGSVVVGAPAVDPTTGSVWVVARSADGSTRDVELAPLTPITEAILPTPADARPKRTAPAWVLAAAAEYRDARDAWLALRESCQPVGANVAGAAGASVSYAQLDDATFREHYPQPRYRDHLRDHAQRQRQMGVS